MNSRLAFNQLTNEHFGATRGQDLGPLGPGRVGILLDISDEASALNVFVVHACAYRIRECRNVQVVLLPKSQHVSEKFKLIAPQNQSMIDSQAHYFQHVKFILYSLEV